MCIPVRVLTGFTNTFIRYLIGTAFPGNPRKIDLMLLLLRIDHDDMNEVLVNGGIEALKTDGAEKINPVPLAEIKPGMLDA